MAIYLYSRKSSTNLGIKQTAQKDKNKKKI